jgi:hypothetical protein
MPRVPRGASRHGEVRHEGVPLDVIGRVVADSTPIHSTLPKVPAEASRSRIGRRFAARSRSHAARATGSSPSPWKQSVMCHLSRSIH